MKLSEYNAPLAFQYNILEKASKKSGVLMEIGGVFQRADTKNANGRVYPRDLWMEVLQRPDVVERIENRRMVGTLGHPSSGQTDPEKVSHVVTKQELRSDGTVYGEAEILDTPTGRVAATMLNAGVGLGISSRGDGSIEKKGGTDEVQNDYRLETYDLVLKPSTPGAYPGMLGESTVEENEKLVADAIDGLVNSEGIPAEQRMGVLAESLKILSALEAENSGDRIKTLSTKIQEEIAAASPSKDPVVTITANESVQQPGFTPVTEENDMGQNQGSAPQLAPDTLAWHQGQVSYYVEQANAAKQQEIDGLKNTLINTQREHTETKKRLKAAESLIEDFTKKIRELEENAGQVVEDPELRRRYDAAVELLDEAIKRLPEIGQLRRRTDTLEQLLQSSIDRVQEDVFEQAVAEKLALIDESYHDAIRPVLEKCSTPEDVEEAFEAFKAVSGTVAPRMPTDPLPNRRLPEEKKPSTPTNKKNFTSLLAGRLRRAV